MRTPTAEIKKALREQSTLRQLVHRAELLAVLGVSYVTLWTWVRQGKFPAPIETGDSHQRARLAWYRDEVETWLAERPRRHVPQQQSEANAS